MSKVLPDISSRPASLTVEHDMRASADAIFHAWTEAYDSWFAEPGTLIMSPEVDVPFFFETHFEGQRHAHYGRFLELEPGRRIVMTWVTGDPGTKGAETVLTIELESHADGTRLTLTHAGFYDDATRKGHEGAWPEGLAILDRSLEARS